MSRWQTDVAIGVVIGAAGIAALWTPEAWAAALLLPLAVANATVPAWLRHRLAAKERALP